MLEEFLHVGERISDIGRKAGIDNDHRPARIGQRREIERVQRRRRRYQVGPADLDGPALRRQGCRQHIDVVEHDIEHGVEDTAEPQHGFDERLLQFVKPEIVI
jgi:hypothetical protein